MKKLCLIIIGFIVSGIVHGMEHSKHHLNIQDMKHFFKQSQYVLHPSLGSISLEARSLANHASKVYSKDKVPTDLENKVFILKQSLHAFEENYEKVNDPIGIPLVADQNLVEAFLFLTVSSEKFDKTVKQLISYAAAQESIETLKYFFDYHKLDPNMHIDEEHHDDTALHWAVLTAKTEAVKWLITKGADVNAIGKLNGDTPLHVACSFIIPDIKKDNFIESAQYLLEQKANVNALNQWNETPIDKLTLHEDENAAHIKKMRELLIAHGGKSGKEIKKPPLDHDEWNDRLYRLPPHQKNDDDDWPRGSWN